MGGVTKAVKFLLLGDAKGATQAFQKVGGEAQTLVGKLKGIGKGGVSLKGVMAGLGVGIAGAVVAGGAALLKFGGDSINTFKRVAGETAGLKRVLGGSAEDASRMGFALKMSGISAATGTKSFQILGKNLAGAATDGKKASAMAKLLGTDFMDANGKVKPMSELMPKLADKFASMPDGAEKTALAMKLFGKAGVSMIPMLNKGSEGMAAMAKKSDELGNTIGGKQLAALQKSKAAQREWDAAMQGLQVTLGGELLPILTQGAEFLNSTMVPAFQGIMQWVQKNEATFQAFGNMLRWVWNNALLPLVKFAITGFIQMNKPLAQAVQALGALTGNKDMETFGAGLVSAADDAQAFADSLQPIPDAVDVTFSAPGSAATAAEAKQVAQAIKAIPDAASTKILAPGARPSKAAVDAFMATVKGIPKDKKTALRTIAQLGGVEAAKKALKGIKDAKPKVTVSGDSKKATDTKNAIDKIPKAKTSTVTTKAPTKPATDLKGKLDAIKSKTVTVTVNVRKTGISSITISGTGGSVRYSIRAAAAGGIFRAMAAGGIAGAKIYGKADGVMFNEPSTEGESFIPLANDWRRPGAVAVWQKTGRLIGAMETGGITGRGASGDLVGGGGDTYNINANVARGVDPLAFAREVEAALVTLKSKNRKLAFQEV